MATIQDINANKLIAKVADKLKSMSGIKPPAWAEYVKTGNHKERVPESQDWWYFRSAAVLRNINRLGPIGVSKLRTRYGGRKNRGHKPDRFMKGSGNIIRKVLQQLEKEQLIKQTQVGTHKGRVVTPKGKSLLDKTAGEVLKQK